MLIIKEIDNLDPIFSEIQKKYKLYYEIYFNDTMVGVAAINESSNDMLYIYIYEKYRGNNYGKEAFDALLNKFKELKVTNLLVMVDNNNIQMLRIISHKKCKIISSENEYKYYEIDLY